MKKIIILFSLTFLAENLTAQESEGVLQGYVFESQTSLPLVGTNVVLVGTNMGDATDSTGFFKIDKIAPGKYELAVLFIGYEVHRQVIEIKSGKTAEVFIKLEEGSVIGSEVAVERDRPDDIRLEITPPTFKMKPEQVEALPGALADVMRSIQTLPGIISPNDFSNQFIVRGGGPNQNLILIDDVEIYNPYRNSGMPSLINPAIVQNVNLYAGGFPALFGDRLSSVLTVFTRDGTNEKWLGGKIGANLIDANFVLEGKTPGLKGSWLLSSRRTYYDLFAESYVEDYLKIFNEHAFPNFEDWYAKLVFQPAQNHRIQFLGILGKNDQDWLVKDELGEQTEERGSLDGVDRFENKVIGAAWNYVPSARLQTKVYVNWYQNEGKSNFSGDLVPVRGFVSPILQGFGGPPPPVFGEVDTTVFKYNQKFDFSKLSFGTWLVLNEEPHVIEAGGGIDFLDNAVDIDLQLNDFGQVVADALQSAPNWFGALATNSDQNETYKRGFAYIQDKWSFFENRAFFQPGLRFDYYEFIDRAYLSPRVKLSFQADPVTTISVASGLYYQSPGFEKLLDGGEIFDILRFDDLKSASAEQAIHNVVGMNRWLNNDLKLTVEGYYKTFDNLINQSTKLVERPVARYVSGAPGYPDSHFIDSELGFELIPTPTNDGHGSAYGLDLHLEKQRDDQSDRWYGSLSYSYSNSKRDEIRNGQRVSFQYDFDRRHSANLVLNYRLWKNLNVGVTWRYGSGFPFTPATGVAPLVAQVAPDSTNPDLIENIVLTDSNGLVRFIPTFGGPENTNFRRYPDYHRLDARVSYSTKMGGFLGEVYLDFINVYNRRNVLFFRNIIKFEGLYANQPQAVQFPKPVRFIEPVYMYPFIASLGFSLSF